MKTTLKTCVSLALCLCMLCSFAMADEATFTGTSRGMNGDVTVTLTMDGEKMTSLSVTDHKETFGIGYGLNETPVEALPSQIIAAQSTNVDMITGATITCAAIMNATKEALKAAGVDPANYSAKSEVTKQADVSLQADVVVIGAGAAGVAAGIEAMEKGANVLILEKQGITGGATTRSGGKLLAAGSEWQKKQGYEDDAEQMFTYLKSIGGDMLKDDMVKAFCDNSLNVLQWVEGMGVQMKDVEAIHSSLTPWRVHNAQGAGGMTSGHGGQFMVPMTKQYESMGGKVVYNATANEILTNEEGKIIGVKAEMKDGSILTVDAKAVILATGGYAQNREIMKNIPEVEGYATSVPKGNLGEGVFMAEKLGAKTFFPDSTQVVYCSLTCGVGINEEAGLIVNDKGARVANEYTYQYHVSDQIAKSGSKKAYYICDASDPNMMVQYGMSIESTPKAETVAELAELIGMDAKTLEETIARYNTLCEKGEDADFGKPADKMIAVKGPMICAIELKPVVTVTYGGLETDALARVLDTNNEPIENLYAAGEVAFSGLFGTEYPCCGMAIGSAMYYGQVAGAQAAQIVK